MCRLQMFDNSFTGRTGFNEKACCPLPKEQNRSEAVSPAIYGNQKRAKPKDLALFVNRTIHAARGMAPPVLPTPTGSW